LTEHLDKGWSGLRENLTALGIFEIMKEGRINIQYLYWVGFGLGRRGGVMLITNEIKYIPETGKRKGKNEISAMGLKCSGNSDLVHGM